MAGKPVMLINNELVEGASTFPVTNPATEEVAGTAPHPSGLMLTLIQ